MILHSLVFPESCEVMLSLAWITRYFEIRSMNAYLKGGFDVRATVRKRPPRIIVYLYDPIKSRLATWHALRLGLFPLVGILVIWNTMCA